MPRVGSRAQLSIAAIQRLLAERMGDLEALRDQRRNLMKQLKSVNREMERMRGGRARGRPQGRKKGRRRGRNERALHEYVKEALAASRKPMRPSEIEESVLKAGYRTEAARFYPVVHQTLGQLVDKGEVQRDKATKTYRLSKS